MFYCILWYISTSKYLPLQEEYKGQPGGEGGYLVAKKGQEIGVSTYHVFVCCDVGDNVLFFSCKYRRMWSWSRPFNSACPREVRWKIRQTGVPLVLKACCGVSWQLTPLKNNTKGAGVCSVLTVEKNGANETGPQSNTRRIVTD